MPIALSEFWTRLVESGITDADGCKRIAMTFCDATGNPPAESVSLAKFLIKSGDLTEFQAREILAKRGLRIGSYVVRSKEGPPPMSSWVPVQSLDGQVGFVFRAQPEHLAGGRDQWIDAHADVAADTLQMIHSEPLASETAVFSPLPAGCSLLHWDRQLDLRSGCEIGIAIADALAALHACSLVHGAVRADRVWMGDNGQAFLLRDPSGPAVSPLVGHAHGWLDDLEQPAAYCAPELSSVDQPCDPTTDIYSLGCLLYRLATGRLPFHGDSIEALLEAHRTQTPTELAEAVQKGESGDPFFRVIAFAMAKNPTARFAAVSQLADALRATLPLIPGRPTPPPAPRSAKPEVKKGESASDKIQSGDTPREDITRRKKTPKPAAATTQSPSKSKPPTSARPPKPPAQENAQQDESARMSPTSPAPKQDDARTIKRTTEEKSKPSQANPPAPKKREASSSTTANSKTDERKSPKVPASSKPATNRSEEKPKVERKVSAAAPPPEAPQTAKSASPSPPPTTPDTNPTGPAVPPATMPEITPPEAPPVPPSVQVGPPPVDDKQGEESPRPLRRRKKKKKVAPFVLGGLCVAILLMMLGLLVDFDDDEEKQARIRPPIPDVIPSVTNNKPSDDSKPRPDAVPKLAGYQLVEDDRLLWAPPYPADSPTAPLQLLPPGPGAVISVRLADVIGSNVGQDVIDSISPELSQLIEMASKRAKVPKESIKRCSIAMHKGAEGWPEVSLAIELSEPQPLSSLTEKWNVSASRTPEGATVYAGDEVDVDAYYIAPQDMDDQSNVSRFAVGSVKRISEVAEVEGAPIALTQAMQRLWSGSSEQSDLVVLITPNFLFADARGLLSSVAPELVNPLKATLIPDVAGALVVADVVDENLYAEVRMAPSGGITEPALLRRLSDTIGGWPQWANGFVRDVVPDASWRLLASRMPLMMRFVTNRTRFGISGGVAVANVYLPSRAVSQVSLAVLLAMNSQAGGEAIVAVTSTKKLTIEEMLDRPMSVSFDQESLEFAINTIVDEFKRSLPAGSTMPPVRIVGGDLEKMGITQNQQIRDFSKSDQPLRSVLTDLVVGANPDKTATGPYDPKQALIWVVTDDSESPGNKVILVTTREAAAAQPYELPAEFVPADDGDE